MSIALASPCTTPGCPDAAAHAGKCPIHHRAYERSPYRTQQRRFYASPEWRALRAQVLGEEPVCECGARTTEADHSRPISAGGAPLDRLNVKGRCKACHSRKTLRENRD